MNEFEDTISSDDSLSQLLNDKRVTAFSNFSRKRYDDAFKEHIEERYYEIFKEIYTNDDNNRTPSQIIALIRSVNYLATERTKSQIIDMLREHLKTAEEKLFIFKESLKADGDTITITTSLDRPIDHMTIKIFNEFEKNEIVNEHKSKIVKIALEICDLVSTVNPKKSPFKYAVYNALMNNLKEIDELGPHANTYQNQEVTITKKRNGIEIKYFVVGGIVLLLLILKVLSRLR